MFTQLKVIHILEAHFVTSHKTRRVLGVFWVQKITGASDDNEILEIFQ